MENYRVNIQDYDLIKKLVETTTSIETLYKRLYDLEIRGLKNTKKYNQ